MYNLRLGRWLSEDVLASKYPSFSPYADVANNPIVSIDPDGREWKIVVNNAAFADFKTMISSAFAGKIKAQVDQSAGLVSLQPVAGSTLSPYESNAFSVLSQVVSDKRVLVTNLFKDESLILYSGFGCGKRPGNVLDPGDFLRTKNSAIELPILMHEIMEATKR